MLRRASCSNPWITAMRHSRCPRSARSSMHRSSPTSRNGLTVAPQIHARRPPRTPSRPHGPTSCRSVETGGAFSPSLHPLSLPARPRVRSTVSSTRRLSPPASPPLQRPTKPLSSAARPMCSPAYHPRPLKSPLSKQTPRQTPSPRSSTACWPRLATENTSPATGWTSSATPTHTAAKATPPSRRPGATAITSSALSIPTYPTTNSSESSSPATS